MVLFVTWMLVVIGVAWYLCSFGLVGFEFCFGLLICDCFIVVFDGCWL